jgi:hypothetical protein
LVKYWLPSDSDRAFYNLPLGWFVDFGTHEEFKKVTKVSGSYPIASGFAVMLGRRKSRLITF